MGETYPDREYRAFRCAMVEYITSAIPHILLYLVDIPQPPTEAIKGVRPVANGNNFDVSPGSHGRDQIKIDLGQHVDTLEEQRANMIRPMLIRLSKSVKSIAICSEPHNVCK